LAAPRLRREGDGEAGGRAPRALFARGGGFTMRKAAASAAAAAPRSVPRGMKSKEGY
jgi:hypothetical protein